MPAQWWESGLPWRQLLQIASFIPPPAPSSLKQPETAVRQICFIYLFHTVPALRRALLMRAGGQACQVRGSPRCPPVPVAVGRKGVGWQKPGGMKGGSVADMKHQLPWREGIS